MKLIVIGRNAQESDLVLVSDYVSNYHAEIIQLDNGDMFIVDKSSNGTYLNGNRLVPGKETPIRRGDNITFADVPLDWSLIQDVNVPAGVRKMVSIGSHYMNAVSVQGPNVSRFHATMCQHADGKWYICDHSKNGTTVNGRRIIKDRYVQLKKGDTISCAGVPVTNPIKPGVDYKLIGICAAAFCVIVGLAFAWPKMFPRDYTDEQLCQKYENAVVMMICDYHFEVESGTLDISQLPDPDSFNKKTGRFTRKMYDKFVLTGDGIAMYDGSNAVPYTGTGFFIGNEGYLATNRHIAKPWESDKISFGDKVITIQNAAEDFYREKLNKLYEMGYTPALQYISQIKVIGKLDDVIIVPNGEFLESRNAYNAYEVVCGSHESNDLAIFKIKSNSLPPSSTYVPIKKIKSVAPTRGMHVLTIGFPFGLSHQKPSKNQIQANNASGTVARNEQKYSFEFTAVSYRGASGSPVFDKKGNLVGVLNAGNSQVQGFNFAIRSEHLADLIRMEGLR